MDFVKVAMSSLIFSTGIFIFWVIKGGFNKRVLYTYNLGLSVISGALSIFAGHYFRLGQLVLLFIIVPSITVFIFILLLYYKFFLNPRRLQQVDENEFISPADGRIIYIKELEVNQLPVSVKKTRLSRIEEITKTDILKQPCYLIGIMMTLFDVHINRAPSSGDVVMVKHTPGSYLSLKSPESTFVNERNTIVFRKSNGIMVGVVQIASRFIRRCICSVKEGDSVRAGEVIGRITWGSQVDLIIPRNCDIFVREGEQVYAGKSIIGRLRE